jgi:hypothetical protein
VKIHVKDLNYEVTVGHATSMIACVCGDVFQASGATDDVSRQQTEWMREHATCTKQPYEAKTFWLGACIVAVTPEEVEDAALEVMLRFPFAQPGAEYIGAATKKAHRLGCNPGGEIATREVPNDHPHLKFYQLGVLMDRATIDRIDAEIEPRAVAPPGGAGSRQHE